MSQRRRVNISLPEKRLLISLITKELKYVEDKNLDIISLKNKRLAWQRITNNFNNHSFVKKRKLDAVRRFWHNLKNKREDIIKDSTDGISKEERLTDSQNYVVELIKNIDDADLESCHNFEEIDMHDNMSSDSNISMTSASIIMKESEARLKDMEWRREQETILNNLKVQTEKALLEAAETKATREREMLEHERKIRSQSISFTP